MKLTVEKTGTPITLTRADYVSEGGQGAVYAQGRVAYKVYHEPSFMIPRGKLAELGAIVDPGVLGPQEVLLDKAGRAVGFTMEFVPDASPLCRLLTRAFRERNAVTPEQVLRLVEGVRDRLSAVHAAGALVVDLNPMNLLVDAALREVFFIDVDSYQTRSYPAGAIMDAVRDRHAPAGVFSEETDWFAFAVVAFQMFAGIHPYRGTHPDHKGLDARMRANVSVFDPEVVVPRSAYGVGAIPPVWRRWFEAAFERGVRSRPPGGAAPVVSTPAAAARPVSGSGRFDLRRVGTFDGPVAAHLAMRGRTCTVTSRSVYVDGRRVQAAPRGVPWAVALTPTRARVVLATLVDGVVALRDVSRGVDLAFGLAAREIVSHDGRLYARTRDSVVEVVLHEVGQGVVASSRVAAAVLPHATRLFPGVALQDMLGARWASLLVGPGRCVQVHLPELDGARVVDARYERGVLVVTTVAEGGGEGSWDRWVFRFDEGHRSRDCRVSRGVSVPSVSFAALDTGVCVQLTEEEQMEVFMGAARHPASTLIEDPMLGRDMSLVSAEGQLRLARGAEVFRMSMR